MPQNVFRKDLQGRFTFANQQYCKHYKCRLEDILGKTDFDFFPKELAEKYQKDDRRVMETGQTYEIIEEHQPLGQEKTIVQVVKTPLYGADGSIIGLQGIFWDITAQKLAEEQIRRANAELARSREELRTKNLLMEENLHMAREIQSAMLPQQYPGFPPHRPAGTKRLSIRPPLSAGGNRQRRFLQRLRAFGDEAGVFICDVTGHGVRAALVTAMIRALVEELKPIAHGPGMFLRKLNSDLCTILKTTGSPMLTTAFYLVADWQHRRHALMPTPAIPNPCSCAARPAASNRSSTLPAKASPPSACSKTRRIKPPRSTIAPGDLVMLFTDGLYEVQGPNEELYSQERMMHGRERPPAQSPPHSCSTNCWQPSARFSVDHEFADDVCLVGMEYTGKPA